jgi:hypothetical protein
MVRKGLRLNVRVENMVLVSQHRVAQRRMSYVACCSLTHSPINFCAFSEKNTFISHRRDPVPVVTMETAGILSADSTHADDS